MYNAPISELNHVADSASNVTQVNAPPGFLLKLSKFSNLSRVTAYCLSFIIILDIVLKKILKCESKRNL